MSRILATAATALLLTTALASAQSDPAGRPINPSGISTSGSVKPAEGISNKTPDGRPMDPAGISSKSTQAKPAEGISSTTLGDGKPAEGISSTTLGDGKPAEGISKKGAAPAATGSEKK